MAREEEDERPWHRDRAVVVRTPNRLDEEAARRAAKETEATLRERLSPAQPPPDQAVDEPAVGDGGSAP
jgi:predicted metal-dependent hydrolase